MSFAEVAVCEAGNILERETLSNVIAYFKAERSSGAIDRADAKIHFSDPKLLPIDAHGGWYDATGDYGTHFSQLDFCRERNQLRIIRSLPDYARHEHNSSLRASPNSAL